MNGVCFAKMFFANIQRLVSAFSFVLELSMLLQMRASENSCLVQQKYILPLTPLDLKKPRIGRERRYLLAQMEKIFDYKII